MTSYYGVLDNYVSFSVGPLTAAADRIRLELIGPCDSPDEVIAAVKLPVLARYTQPDNGRHRPFYSVFHEPVLDVRFDGASMHVGLASDLGDAPRAIRHLRVQRDRASGGQPMTTAAEACPRCTARLLTSREEEALRECASCGYRQYRVSEDTGLADDIERTRTAKGQRRRGPRTGGMTL